MQVIFDIETDGVDATKVHCIGAKEVRGGHSYRFGDHGEYDGSLDVGVEFLSQASTLIGHNIVGYDLPVLARLKGMTFEGRVYDTMASARFWLPDEDLKDADRKRSEMPQDLFGRHSLAAWGFRLGLPKMASPETFDEWTPEMGDYCAADVDVTERLYLWLLEKDLPEASRAMEQEFYGVCARMRERGVRFDLEEAERLSGRLLSELEEARQACADLSPGWTTVRYTPKRRLPRDVHVPFNPGSRQHVARYLKERGWVPKAFTETGQPKVSETTLKDAAKTIPEAAQFSRLLLIRKRLGQLADGERALLKYVDPDGRIRGYVSHNGCTTTRCLHAHPNLANVPRVKSPYGKEFRGLFKAPEGGGIVGADMKGLELRMLAHYLAPFDGGRYVKVVSEGDPHAENQRVAGLTTRDLAKTFIYALLYGAGDEKLGAVVGGTRADGRALRKRVLGGFLGFKDLLDAIQERLEKTGGFLKGLDGRLLRVRHEHAALNTILQSGGSIVMKRFAIDLDQRLTEAAIPAGIILQVHDELQIEVEERGFMPAVAEIARAAAQGAGAYFSLRCPTACDAQVGETWAETH